MYQAVIGKSPNIGDDDRTLPKLFPGNAPERVPGDGQSSFGCRPSSSRAFARRLRTPRSVKPQARAMADADAPSAIIRSTRALSLAIEPRGPSGSSIRQPPWPVAK